MKLNPSRCTLVAILLAFGALMDVLPAQEAVPKSLPLGVAGAQDAGVKPAADDAVKDVFTSTGAAESVLEGAFPFCASRNPVFSGFAATVALRSSLDAHRLRLPTPVSRPLFSEVPTLGLKAFIPTIRDYLSTHL